MVKKCRMPKNGWVCFHCGETFKTYDLAKNHFGETSQEITACIIKAGSKKSLLTQLQNTKNRLKNISDAESYIKQQFEFVRAQELCSLIENHIKAEEMKGILTEEELTEAIKGVNITAYGDKEKFLKALKLYLVDGCSSSYAMDETGIHRAKITSASKIIMDNWRIATANKTQ